MKLEEKKLYCAIVAHLFIIDGQLTDQEHAFIYALMGELGLSVPEQRDVLESVNVDSSVVDQVAGLAPEVRDQLLRELRMAASADGSMSEIEADVIELVRRHMA